MKKALLIPVEGDASIIDLDANLEGSLKALQGAVEGYIECVSLMRGVDMWVNEEGKYTHPINLRATNIAIAAESLFLGDYISGPAVVARSDEDGDTVGLTDEDILAFGLQEVS
jgi:hypothetical protein